MAPSVTFDSTPAPSSCPAVRSLLIPTLLLTLTLLTIFIPLIYYYLHHHRHCKRKHKPLDAEQIEDELRGFMPPHWGTTVVWGMRLASEAELGLFTNLIAFEEGRRRERRLRMRVRDGRREYGTLEVVDRSMLEGTRGGYGGMRQGERERQGQGYRSVFVSNPLELLVDYGRLYKLVVKRVVKTGMT